MNEIKDDLVVRSIVANIIKEMSYGLMTSKMDDKNNMPVALYLVYKVSNMENSINVDFKMLVEDVLDVNEDIKDFARVNFTEKFWEYLPRFVEKYPSMFLKMAVIKAFENIEGRVSLSTPHTILKLVHELLDVKENERVADICCGNGSYFLSAVDKERNASYFGYDVNKENIVIVNMLADLIGAKINVEACDVFSLDGNCTKFNKIFSNYPFGLKVKNLGEGAEYFKRMSEQYPDISKATSSDWIFNSLLCDLIEENGKAVGIMTNGSTWNTIDTPMRKYFVEKKMVECVISLPNKMFTSTTIPTTIIVLSNNNESVRMIDASMICQQGRRQNELSDDNIETIMRAMSRDTSFSKLVSLEELRENEYVLNLSRYLKEELPFENGVTFESIMKNITRGAQCTASQLDEIVSDDVTDMQYLMLGNIKNGMIDDKLPYISKIELKYEKYCLKNNSLILSKNGYPYKVAIVNVKENQKILANGNLYIIELDEEKANPYYIKAFLESEYGTAALKEITVGATIPNIGVDKLKKIIIPLPSMAEQNKIAQKYQDTLDEIARIKLQLEETTQKLTKIFEC